MPLFCIPTLAETNEKSRLFLKAKADEYLNRAEAIRQSADMKTQKQPGGPGLPTGHTHTAQSVVLDVSATERPRRIVKQLT